MSRGTFDMRRLQPGDEALVIAAADLFDETPQPKATGWFLAESGHHLLLAFEGEKAAGFITEVETIHPDKGAEMLVYELGLRESSRRRGIATALVEALGGVARERGYYGMWVLTDGDNGAALRTYAKTGGGTPSEQVMVDWTFRAPADGSD